MKRIPSVFFFFIALTIGLFGSAKAQAQVNMSRFIKLTVAKDSVIKLDFKAATDNTPVKVKSGSLDTTFMVGTALHPKAIGFTAGDSTMTVYGDLTAFFCRKNQDNITTLDVSNNTLSVAAAYRYPDNRIDIVDYRRQPIDIDTSNGIIHNPNNILSRLNDCMQDIERHLNVKIGRYYLGIEPHTLRSETKQLSTTSAGNDISQTINRLTEEAKNTYSHDERSFLCSYPLETYLGATVKGDFLILSLADEVKAQIDKIFANLSTERKAIMRVAPTVEADTFVAESRKGEGVLRKAIINELNRHFKGYTYQDASFQEYGYGATLVKVKR